MFDYTGYENQVKQMKAAGLNPALMNGGGGSAGQANAGESEPKIKMPIIQMEMGGLCLKTLQSDIFNNWVNKEWVDGDNGIKAITDVAITDGKLNLDSLNIAQKVYNMLNRIAVSGGSYKDWIETVYTTRPIVTGKHRYTRVVCQL